MNAALIAGLDVNPDAPIYSAPAFTVVRERHAGRLVYRDNDLITYAVAPFACLVTPTGEAARVEEMMRDGRCAVSWEDSETVEDVVGWTVRP